MSPQLPGDALTLIFDWLSLSQLLRAAQVCKLWLEMAHAHRTYWHDIHMPAHRPLGTARRAIILQRLAHNDASGQINMFIDTYDDSDGEEYVTVTDAARDEYRVFIITRILQANIVRLVSLTVSVPDDGGLQALAHSPAPLLEFLELLYDERGECELPGVLPGALFAGAAPKLRKVVLQNVFPYSACEALHYVRDLRLEVPDAWMALPECFFESLPVLERLQLGGVGLEPPSATAHLAAFAALQRLELSFDWGNDEFLSALPASGFHELAVSGVEDEGLYDILQHLLSPLDLRFDRYTDPPSMDTTAEVDIVVRSLRDGKLRVFRGIDRWALPHFQSVHGLLLRGTDGGRAVRELSILADLWLHIAGWLPVLPALETLRIEVENNRDIMGMWVTPGQLRDAYDEGAAGDEDQGEEEDGEDEDEDGQEGSDGTPDIGDDLQSHAVEESATEDQSHEPLYRSALLGQLPEAYRHLPADVARLVCPSLQKLELYSDAHCPRHFHVSLVPLLMLDVLDCPREGLTLRLDRVRVDNWDGGLIKGFACVEIFA